MDHERVDQDGRGQAEPDHLDQDLAVADEAGEHRGHDQRGSHHHPGAVPESGDHRLGGPLPWATCPVASSM
jgi:hypothetical protein